MKSGLGSTVFTLVVVLATAAATFLLLRPRERPATAATATRPPAAFRATSAGHGATRRPPAPASEPLSGASDAVNVKVAAPLPCGPERAIVTLMRETIDSLLPQTPFRHRKEALEFIGKHSQEFGHAAAQLKIALQPDVDAAKACLAGLGDAKPPRLVIAWRATLTSTHAQISPGNLLHAERATEAQTACVRPLLAKTYTAAAAPNAPFPSYSGALPWRIVAPRAKQPSTAAGAVK